MRGIASPPHPRPLSPTPFSLRLFAVVAGVGERGEISRPRGESSCWLRRVWLRRVWLRRVWLRRVWLRRVLAALFASLFVFLPLPSQGDDGWPLPITGPTVPELTAFDELLLAVLTDNQVPGAALAITKDGKLIYARGFGWADPAAKEKVLPTALFRIASVSKPITAVAILLLVERGKLKLDDRAFELLALEPLPGRHREPRLKNITIRHLLQHTAGFDREKSFDPMFRPVLIAKEAGAPPPAGPEQVIRYMLGQPLDFDPGARYAYSNFGYCVLGRIIEKVSGQSYEDFVRNEVLRSLGITQTRLGKTLQRAPGEVTYHDAKDRTGKAVLGADFGKPVPMPYGAWYLEAMDAHGGWISSAVDLVRFAAALDDANKSPLLKKPTIEAMFARPDGRAGYDAEGKPLPVYYGLGWNVRPERGGFTAWHNGALDGTASLLVRRYDGIDWAVVMNSRTNAKGQYLGKLIDPLLHQAAAKVKRWPAKEQTPPSD